MRFQKDKRQDVKDERDIEIRETGFKSNERHKKPEMKDEKDKIQEIMDEIQDKRKYKSETEKKHETIEKRETGEMRYMRGPTKRDERDMTGT